MASARRDRDRTLAAADTGIQAQQQYSAGGQQAMKTVRGLLSGGLGDDAHFKAVQGEEMRLAGNRMRAQGKTTNRGFSEALAGATMKGMSSALQGYQGRVQRGNRANMAQANLYGEKAGAYEQYAIAKSRKKNAFLKGGAQMITGAITGNYPAAAEGAMGMYKADDAAGVYG